jgi:hypothetical protein
MVPDRELRSPISGLVVAEKVRDLGSGVVAVRELMLVSSTMVATKGLRVKDLISWHYNLTRGAEAWRKGRVQTGIIRVGSCQLILLMAEPNGRSGRRHCEPWIH